MCQGQGPAQNKCTANKTYYYFCYYHLVSGEAAAAAAGLQGRECLQTDSWEGD